MRPLRRDGSDDRPGPGRPRARRRPRRRRPRTSSTGPARSSEGDVFLHNDPYNGGTHQADGLVCRPIFVDGDLLGFAANRGHWSDIGGMAPGGWSGAAEDVVQEGLRRRPSASSDQGEVVEDLRRLILRNVRLPVPAVGRHPGADRVEHRGRAADSHARRPTRPGRIRGRRRDRARLQPARFLAALEAIPDGEASGERLHEDDNRGNGPFTIRVRLVKTPAGVVADFTGTDPQAQAPINSTLACTKAGVVAVVVALSDPAPAAERGRDRPDRGRSRRRVRSCTRCSRPPTFGATADPVDRVSETLLKAFDQLVPERVRAGSYSTGNNVTGGGLGPDGQPFLWYSYQSGGCGAVAAHDGNSSEWHLMGNSKNESMEAWEARYPVEFLGYRLVPDSGGAGRFRGGLGTERRFRLLTRRGSPGSPIITAPARAGSRAARPGLPNRFLIERAGVTQPIEELYDLPSPSKFSNLQLRPGDVFVSVQGGGGGYGEPAQRDPASVVEDLADGYVSDAGAAAYGLRDGDR